ncbi:hypothetical protein LBMAG56_46800 [Verrucomicrobiota bacterium]|nr:hypothetical protein LBMAG56_46800 [Verrucomicrobiota bacterium]
MNANDSFGQWNRVSWQFSWRRAVRLVTLVGAVILGGNLPAFSAPGVVLWDTDTPLPDAAALANRAGWKAVPTELFAFEASPAKAISDPGYWGREHAFKGDAVVENPGLLAVFSAARGSLTIYAKTAAEQSATPNPAPAAAAPAPGRKIAEIVPFASAAGANAGKSRVAIIRNAGDEVVLEVTYASAGANAGAGAAAGKGAPGESALFSFGRNEIVELKPTGALKGLRVLTSLDYGVLPSFIGDDLLYDPAAFPEAKALAIPSENMFVGLPPGEDRMLVVTWPKGQQQVRLGLADAVGRRRIESLELQGDGQSFFLASLTAPGIWHREPLKLNFLEKDVTLEWKRPFPAKWKTQLSEAGTRTTYAFRQAKGTVWRGVPGSYDFPAWFDGETAFLRLGKKVPPKGDALIYFLEARETPATVTTPVDILKATLGRPMSEAILDPAGRKLRTHHRRGGESVHRACTCGYTEAIEAVFKAKEETSKQAFIADAIEDMIFFVRSHMDRINEYRSFADEMTKHLRAQGQSAPELKPFLENLEAIVQVIPQEYEVQKENMKSLDHAADLAKQTMALASKVDPDNLKTYAALLKAWRGMGGAGDYVLAQCHTVTRKLFQEAGYACAELPKAVAAAEDIRARCRQVLRNADGYEIWADY